MKFLNNPNLPDSKVSSVVIGKGNSHICHELKMCGIDVAEIQNNNIAGALSTHADMLVFDAGCGKFIIDVAQNELCEKINKLGGRLEKIAFPENAEYPQNVLLNASLVGKFLICNRKTVSQYILNLDNFEIIDVKQGYSKCSTCIVNSEAIITDDVSIYNATKNLIDVLMINKGTIKLKGFNYGFIGGASVKLDKNTLAFTGTLSSHSDSENIKDFLRNHSIDAIELTNSQLEDIGGIIPLTVESV